MYYNRQRYKYIVLVCLEETYMYFGTLTIIFTGTYLFQFDLETSNICLVNQARIRSWNKLVQLQLISL